MHIHNACAMLPSITTINDVRNEFLSRRELVCDFEGGSGTLKKLDAIKAVIKEHSLEGKVVVPIRIQNHVGKKYATGTFFVYDDEALAKKHIIPAVFKRIEKLETAKAEAEKPAETEATSDSEEKTEAAADNAPKEDKATETPSEAKKEKTEAPADDTPKETKASEPDKKEPES